jgi:hypothetical protein
LETSQTVEIKKLPFATFQAINRREVFHLTENLPDLADFASLRIKGA